jgi:hypothetical protein
LVKEIHKKKPLIYETYTRGLLQKGIVRGEELLRFKADGVVLANLDAGAPQTFIHAYGHGLGVLEGKDLHWADVGASGLAGACVFIHRNDPGHTQPVS